MPYTSVCHQDMGIIMQEHFFTFHAAIVIGNENIL